MQSLHPRRGWECTTAQEPGSGPALIFARSADSPTCSGQGRGWLALLGEPDGRGTYLVVTYHLSFWLAVLNLAPQKRLYQGNGTVFKEELWWGSEKHLLLMLKSENTGLRRICNNRRLMGSYKRAPNPRALPCESGPISVPYPHKRNQMDLSIMTPDEGLYLMHQTSPCLKTQWL